MAETFDIGPLSWVKDEIDQSLKKVHDSFILVMEKPNEVATLRFTTAHLYQVSGALDMVGLQGCKRYCSEIEKLTSKLEKLQVQVSPPVMTALIQAVDALSRYLQDLLNGMQDTPTRLYESLNPLVELQGESLDISDLFYPDTSYNAPKDLASNPIEESAIPIFISEQRPVFQKALLDWLRNKDPVSLNQMRLAILNVQQVQQKNALKTLWWIATAFTDALAQVPVAEQAGARKLCSRLDQQLRNMSLGDLKAPSQLLRNLLYYVAVSDNSSDEIDRVKKLFELDEFLPANDRHGATTATAAEGAALAQLSADLPILKDLWTSVSTSNSVMDFDSFADKLNHLSMVLLSLNNQKVLKLINAIQATVKALQTDKVKINESALIEVAASLNLLEYIGEYYQQLDAEADQKITTQTSRLQSIIEGKTLAPAVDAFASEHLDANVTQAVAKQIISELQRAEKAFDTYFRNPENVAVLDETTKPLQQVAAAFDMLEMPVPKTIAQLASVYVEHFKVHSDGASSHSQFELVAESLSMLGLYAEELPNIRAESESALSSALMRLEQGAKALNVLVENSDQAESELPAGDVLEISDTAHLSTEMAVVDLEANVNKAVTDKAVDEELQDIFLTEAEEVLASLAQHLQTLRVNPTESEALIEVRRAYHTLKGSGRTVGLLGISDVAWAVEKLLNLVMERKAFPSVKQLAFVENVSADFAGWVAELQENQTVTLDPTPFQQRATELESEFEHDLAVNKPKPQKEEVLIGGTRTLSKAFFNIFLAEAQQHLETLVDAQKALVVNSTELPTDDSCRAAHTLGSNALTAGFNPTGDLARALERWLDEHTSIWTEQHITLYGNVVKALADGLKKAKALKNPKSARALILALSESTAAMQAIATQQAEAAVLEHQTDAIGQSAQNLNTYENLATDGVQLDEEINEATIEIIPTAIDENEIAEAIQEVKEQAEATPLLLNSAVLADIPVNKLKELAVDQELLGLFVEEARELVPQVGRDLRGWRANPHEAEYPDSLQRALHTLKGSARMAGQSNIGDSVHKMEDRVIHALRHKATADDFDEMFVEFDHIGYMLEDITGGAKVSIQDIEVAATATVPTRSAERKSQFLRMRADVLDRLINEAGEVSIMRSRMDREMQSFKQSSSDLTDSISRMRAYLRELEIEAETQMQSRMSLLQEANETFDPLEFDRFTRLQELTRMMAESVNDVATIQHGLVLNLDQTDAALQQQNRMNRELQQGLMGVRMLPFATISERLQRIVRQTARELNKRVEMEIQGENIELDRGVLDKMGAPLEHLLRNAVAHGLESTDERKKLGKPEAGQIKLKVSLENDEITLIVTDDGGGINLAKVKQKAIERGLLSVDQEVSDQALMAVIFEPGFSTADSISQIAGRGVGLDAVRSDIAALSGRIDVSNVTGMGAMFNIYLPVTLSVAQVIMARVGNKMFAIPSVMVEQVQKLKQADLLSAYQAHNVSWAGRDYPLHYLSKLIGDVDHVAQQHTYTPVVLLRSGTYRTALHVDEIIGNQEVVMKQIGTQLARVPGMIGATVLGDGVIVLVINPVQLANREALSIGAIKVTTFAPVAEVVKKVALVVDDSLTMRKVLSRVLEREDFEVITANDGMDAIQKLQLITPDIILTDIEMPRMDGFEFSRHVRDNEMTANIPLIVISSRTAEKHRNVAKELGVNAFLGKPVQDEELIEQVKVLLNK
ncbi:MAG: Hpt domain-containing protein [Methylotenera sp.]|uniref:hybrid sensor histidine kinase/response regulator n=1 Tax=Methylotenera sp. TaxID=2051956 RepID=UPI002488A341|nr:Hpt domain-containing protein [Methylotenera sp.]MDI1307968.1 Hpt domain-containing protein [Methylotenera sp.]